MRKKLVHYHLYFVCNVGYPASFIRRHTYPTISNQNKQAARTLIPIPMRQLDLSHQTSQAASALITTPMQRLHSSHQTSQAVSALITTPMR